MEQIKEGTLYRKIDKTMYQIKVRESSDAKASAEDILVRLIAADSMHLKENNDG